MAWLPAAAVVASEIPYPLVHGRARDVLTVVTVALFATASLAHAFATRSWRVAMWLLVVFGLGGLGAEVVGVHTEMPFGSYRYTGGLGPTVAGVPLVIGLAWTMMAWPAACVAARLCTADLRLTLVAVTALATWDVFLDPQMVDAHHWTWLHTSPHLPGVPDVPLSNFGGWLLVSLLLMAILLAGTRAATPSRRDGPMLALWIWTWLSSTLANLAFFHRPAVAGWGFAAMGVVGVPLLATLRRQVISP